MPLPLESVVKQLSDSGIIAQGKLENFVPPKAHPNSAEELIAELVKQNHLTRFQAQAVAAGKARSLILGEYTILDKIGAGGMGQVFKALHRRMERVVAIKMLPPAMTKDPAALARFQREVVAAAKLEHPNIVHANDAGQAGTAHFLVMQFVDGRDLSARVKKDGPLSVDSAVGYILQAARGLEYAHKRGVIHRDIKPANLLLDAEGTVKILDMGLARIDAGGNAPTQAELTGTGAVMGTVDYMAPEQAKSTHHADARADIYSLGCSLYYLLAGGPLYDGATLVEKLWAHQANPIPELLSVRPDVPEQLEVVFSRMVAKQVADRYQTMSEVIADLQTCNVGHTEISNTSPRPLGGEGLGVRGLASRSGSPSTTDSNSNLSFLKQTVAPTTIHRKTVKQPKASGEPRSKKPLLIGGGLLSVVLIAALVAVTLRSQDAPVPTVDHPEVPVQPGNSQQAGEVSPPAAAPDFALQFDSQKQTIVNVGQSMDLTKTFTIEAFAMPTFSGKVRTTGAVAWFKYVVGLELRPESGIWQFDGQTGPNQPWGVPGWQAQPNVRVHLAGCRNYDELCLYINGQLSGRRTISGFEFRNLKGQLAIGDGFNGIIDEVRISSTRRYREAFEVPQRFEPDDQTVALYHFDEGAGDVLIDSSLNGHHGRIQNATWVRADGSPINAATPASSGKLFMHAPDFPQWMKDVQALPAAEQITAVSKKLVELNPQFDGSITAIPGREIAQFQNGAVAEIMFSAEHIVDLSPVRALSGLRALELLRSRNARSQIQDLSPLSGLPLGRLAFGYTMVTDLSPLAGMPLKTLNLESTRITDLTPLKGMPLTGLNCQTTQVADLSPLQECKSLVSLNVRASRVTPAAVAARTVRSSRRPPEP